MISNSYVVPTFIGSVLIGKGAICGYAGDSNTFPNTYYNVDTSDVGGSGGAIGLTTSEMKSSANYNFLIGYSGNRLNDGYPFLGWQDNQPNTWLIGSASPFITINNNPSVDSRKTNQTFEVFTYSELYSIDSCWVNYNEQNTFFSCTNNTNINFTFDINSSITSGKIFINNSEGYEYSKDFVLDFYETFAPEINIVSGEGLEENQSNHSITFYVEDDNLDYCQLLYNDILTNFSCSNSSINNVSFLVHEGIYNASIYALDEDQLSTEANVSWSYYLESSYTISLHRFLNITNAFLDILGDHAISLYFKVSNFTHSFWYKNAVVNGATALLQKTNNSATEEQISLPRWMDVYRIGFFYFDIPKYANVTQASFNLTAQEVEVVGKYCTQQQANASHVNDTSGCTFNFTGGSYSSSGNWSDGNEETATSLAAPFSYSVNYTIPANISLVSFEYKGLNRSMSSITYSRNGDPFPTTYDSGYFTGEKPYEFEVFENAFMLDPMSTVGIIPLQCIDKTNGKLELKYSNKTGEWDSVLTQFSCKNNSGSWIDFGESTIWHDIETDSRLFYEEAVTWAIKNYSNISDFKIRIGNVGTGIIQNSSEELSEFQSDNLFADLNNYLSDGKVYCSQEQANELKATDDSCSNRYFGTYSQSGSDLTNFYDGDRSSYVSTESFFSQAQLNISYYKPMNLSFTGANFQILFSNATDYNNKINKSIQVQDICFNDSQVLNLKMNVNYNTMFSTGTVETFCLYKNEYVMIDKITHSSGPIYLFEESIAWFTSEGECDEDAYGNCQVPIAIYSDTAGKINMSNINITYTIQEHIESELNQALNLGTCDCDGCEIIGGNCSIPITFYMESGSVNYNATVDSVILRPNVISLSPSNSTYNNQTQNFSTNSTSYFNFSNATLNVYNNQTGNLYYKETFGKEYALDFDSDSISLGNSSDFNFQEFTMSFWVKALPRGDAYQSLATKSNWSSGGYALAIREQGTILFYSPMGVDNWAASGGLPLFDGDWHNIIFSYDGATKRIFIDGAITSSKNVVTAKVDSVNSLVIGSGYNGSMDEIRIYNRNLSNSEILEINSSGRKANSNLPSNGLISWYDFNEGSGTMVIDKMGANNGTITGATYVEEHDYASDFVSQIGDSFQMVVSTVINFVDGIYTWFWSVFDINSNEGVSVNTTLTIATSVPEINIVAPTENSGVYKNQNWIFFNTSIIDDNFKNVTYYLYKDNSLINTTTYTEKIESINFTGLVNGVYKYNSTAYNIFENKGSSLTRNITLDTTTPLISFVAPT
jgi:hypothetical protein